MSHCLSFVLSRRLTRRLPLQPGHQHFELAARPRNGAAGTPGCTEAGMQGCRDAREQGCTEAGMHASRRAGQQPGSSMRNLSGSVARGLVVAQALPPACLEADRSPAVRSVADAVATLTYPDLSCRGRGHRPDRGRYRRPPRGRSSTRWRQTGRLTGHEARRAAACPAWRCHRPLAPRRAIEARLGRAAAARPS